jgi:hypothetical protein
MPRWPRIMHARIALLTTALAVAPVAATAEPANTVQLAPSPAVAPGIEAFPRLIASPDDRAAQRIDRALAHGNDRVRHAAQSCLHTSDSPAGNKPWWNRTVSVTMRGPGYLSMVAADDWYCGGAYPNTEQQALVYDLRTGAPLNWKRLLPASLAAATATDTAGDGTTIGTVSSPALAVLYIKTVVGQSDAPEDCKQVLTDPSLSLNFMLWPDATHDGLALAPFGLIHAVAACGPAAVLPTATLRKLGVDAKLLDAIDAAHARSD